MFYDARPVNIRRAIRMTGTESRPLIRKGGKIYITLRIQHGISFLFFKTQHLSSKPRIFSRITDMTKWDDLLVNNGARIHQGHGRRLASVPAGDREIDKEGGVRTRPMKVILASMSRTGTVCKLPYCPSSRAMKLSRRYQ